MTVDQKIQQLRKLMSENGFDAYIIPSSDPHISEYLPDHWKSREWISEFNGSVGSVVVTKDHAGLWTDGRYFLQANTQLKGTEIELHKLGVPGSDDYPEWLNKTLDSGAIVGFDGSCLSVSIAKKLESTFDLKSIKINPDLDLVNEFWENRSELPKDKVFEHPEKYAGMSREEKLKSVRNGLKDINCTDTLISSLDDIAWVLNIRGYDVAFNPVALSHLHIGQDSCTLFIEGSKVENELKSILNSAGVQLKDYYDVEAHLNQINNATFLIDPVRSNYKYYSVINKNNRVVLSQNISTCLKAVKNEDEIKGMQSAMHKDCMALVDFCYWLENTWDKETIDELHAGKELSNFRSKGELFYGDSFNAITGFAGNGAIIHYASSETTTKNIDDSNFFLLDSGGQYFDGTTDITRVFHLGQPTAQQKTDYTNVLKGLIRIMLQKFPRGTRGSQLDILARQDLWNRMENYAHGTGHGVGCFLNVHEGPQSIRTEENPTLLKERMILSNEPGIYRADQWGVRLENIIYVEKKGTSEFGDFLGFENLTLYPFESHCIDKSLLTQEEIDWINDYHKTVFDSVKNDLDPNKKQWFKKKCQEI